MNTAVVPIKRPSLLATMATEYQMDAEIFASTIRKTCMPQNSSNEEFAAFLMVAHKHGLNPVTREIYAFPKKGGGIQPIVGVDGWMTLINSHPNFDGMDFEDKVSKNGELEAITCRIHRKDRSHAVAVTEYMEECRRATEPWQKWPARMLRHKAAIQAARYAFSFSGIIDPEEAERSPEVITDAVMAPAPTVIEPAQDGGLEDGLRGDDIFDFTAFCEELELAFAGAHTPEDVEQAWADMDVVQTLADDADGMATAVQMKDRRLAEIGLAQHPVAAG